MGENVANRIPIVQAANIGRGGASFALMGDHHRLGELHSWRAQAPFLAMALYRSVSVQFGPSHSVPTHVAQAHRLLCASVPSTLNVAQATYVSTGSKTIGGTNLAVS